jgi:hypothetical protein
MRIVVASTYVPFRNEGEVTLVHNLAAALRERDHLVDVVLIPFDWSGHGIPEQTLAIRSLDLTESAGNRVDLLITLRAPAHAIPHSNKVVWFRDHPCEALTRYDATFLPEAKRIYARSRVAADRLKRSNAIDTNGVLYPPLLRLDNGQGGDYGDHFL